MFDQIYLMLYNLFFTSLPPLALGIYDRIAPASILLETPKLYERGRLALAYQPHYFWVTIADALYQSVVIFLVTTAVSIISFSFQNNFPILFRFRSVYIFIVLATLLITFFLFHSLRKIVAERSFKLPANQHSFLGLL